MTTRRYSALKVTQRPGAPSFYVLRASARELLAWCDVPRAKGDYMAGYQRPLHGKRTAALTKYLALAPENIVPGAVIVAVDSDHVTISDDDGSGIVEIQVAEDSRDFRTRLEELWGGFTTRLSVEELASTDIEYVVPAETASGAEDTVTEDSPAADSSVREFDDLDADTEEEDAPKSYLAVLAQELSLAIQNWDGLPEPRQNAIRDFIESASKPGLIIDGQHRVFGASALAETDIVLPVVLLPGLQYAEQVFQFYVLNSKAQPLRATELRRIVSTTLTNSEIEALYDRFKQAGVVADEAQWTYRMQSSPDSPFRGRINMGFKEPGAIIPENVADQVVRAFMGMPRSRYAQLTDPLGELWTDGDKRLRIFFWFWTAIRESYGETWKNAERSADGGVLPQLFMKVSMLTLQKFLLETFVTVLSFRKGSPPPLSSPEEVKAMVSSTLEKLPGKLFDKTWKKKQMDTTEGRAELYKTMEHVYRNRGEVHGRLAIFQG